MARLRFVGSLRSTSNIDDEFMTVWESSMYLIMGEVYKLFDCYVVNDDDIDVDVD